MGKIASNGDEYLVSLPSGYELGFEVATPQYNSVPKMALTKATTPKGAVGNVVFRALKNQNVGRRVMAALRDSRRGTESYAFVVPEVEAEDGKPLSRLERDLSMEVFLAQEIADKQGGEAKDKLPYARNLLDFRRKSRV